MIRQHARGHGFLSLDFVAGNQLYCEYPVPVRGRHHIHAKIRYNNFERKCKDRLYVDIDIRKAPTFPSTAEYLTASRCRWAGEGKTRFQSRQSPLLGVNRLQVFCGTLGSRVRIALVRFAVTINQRYARAAGTVVIYRYLIHNNYDIKYIVTVQDAILNGNFRTVLIFFLLHKRPLKFCTERNH